MCKDNALTYLNRLGYNVVRLPRADIKPGQVLLQQHGTLQWVGTLQNLIENNAKPLPPIEANLPAADVNGQSSSELSAEVGTNILGSFLKQFDGDMNITTAVKSQKSVTFRFTDVLADRIDTGSLSVWFDGEALRTKSALFRLPAEGKGRFMIITEVLKTNKFLVDIVTSAGGSAKIDAEFAKSTSGPNLKVAVAGQSANKITLAFTGTATLGFGFRCTALDIRGGVPTMENIKPGEALALVAADDQTSMYPVLGEELLDIEDHESLQQSSV